MAKIFVIRPEDVYINFEILNYRFYHFRLHQNVAVPILTKPFFDMLHNCVHVFNRALFVPYTVHNSGPSA